jgi:hypothetical protein
VKKPLFRYVVLSAVIAVVILVTGSASAQTRRIIRFQKLSDSPVSVDSTGWSALYQNEIMLKENTGPADSFTVIDVSTPTNPQRMSCMDSAAARRLSLQTMIPVFLYFNVSNRYANMKVVNLSGSRMLIAKDSTVGMYQISGSNLINLASYTVHGLGNNNLNLMSFTDSLLGIQSSVYRNEYSQDDRGFYFTIVKLLLTSPWFTTPAINLDMATYWWYDMGTLSVLYEASRRPYFHGVASQDLLISYDMSTVQHCACIPPDLASYYHGLVGYNTSTLTPRSISCDMPYANAYNTNQYFSATENLCTGGFYPYMFQPSCNGPTKLFAAAIGDFWPYSTASADSAIYLDTVHLQCQIQNIILDTLAQRVYLIFNNNMTILGYQSQIVGVAGGSEKSAAAAKGIFILPNAFSSGVTIVLQAHAASVPADLYFYDLSGRVIDKMLGITANAVLWRPKTRSMGCYIVSVRIGTEKLTRKFMVR